MTPDFFHLDKITSRKADLGKVLNCVEKRRLTRNPLFIIARLQGNGVTDF